MRTKTVYLASAIDQGQAWSMRAEAREALLKARHAVYDPAAGWSVPEASVPSPSLQKANLAALRACDGLLVCLDPSILSIGIVIEMMEAINLDVPVVAYGKLSPSWSLAYLGIDVFTELEDAIAALDWGMDV
jgi:nucleoside 2-deoxyribosyltransferase